ncbi:xanthine dehydrogenase family protein molybdopterin-binding subunit [Rhodoplanes sp. Z2-YC6860]|uniref:xanthine dehydrogenase family protein molybdopterin-binding subunit n=1 Tax=Rhodoplanes sp. Z2-YC6860 TaxID=674703 RepID=UPI00078D0EB7|nr:xanthine dehydrogenase family protein molybdopterin-binding subunit [Rhodoplanes sp. Z2-YC6860]AMN39575.1 aerobic-type carbon monoxide dehydrogenase, large subunit CoxL/CutL-like protein [Rhodoplanes sp. Z2-YC6860]
MDTTTSHPATKRVEDDYLLRGTGRYMADAPLPGQTYAAFVRSPHGHADVKSVKVDAALAIKGVVAVITMADITAAGVKNLSQHPPVAGRNGGKLAMPVRPALAGERVRHIGEAVAMVLGETAAAAQDGAEVVEVEYEPLEAVTDIREALKPGAPQVWAEAPGNVAVDWMGLAANPDEMAKKVDEAIKSAAHVARVSLVHQRINVASMEPRGGTASYDKANDSYLLRVCSQGARAMRDAMAGVMGIPPTKIRVTTEEVGGAFGLKTGPYPEYVAMLVGSKKIGRPVHWMSGRNESFVSDNHARDAYSEVELALDASGKFLALRLRHDGSLGAYVGAVGANIHTANFTRCLPGMYDIKLMDVQAKCVFTNTTPTAPYRGAGRPEASYCLERVVDEAARVTGIDPVKLRKKNLISKKAMPYKTAIGTTYDSGDFATVVDAGLKLADYAGFKARKKESKKKGLLRGLGVCFVLEHAGGSPTEGTQVVFPGGDKMTFVMNVQSTGQSHATIFPRMVAERLGIKADQVGHAHGDSAHEIAGYASVGSRTAMTAGHAMVKTLEAMLAKGTKVAAAALEAGEGDIEFKNGAFNVVGTDRRMSLFDVAARAKEMKQKGEIAEDLDTKVVTDTPLTFPNGCHIAEVEVDPATGLSRLASYTAVDDSGNILDHTIVAGQVHGSVAMGVGQAMMEQTVYDDGGQLVSASFMDYAMPRADDLPSFKDDVVIVPATTNPLGVKGAGEAGTTAAIAAVMNAFSDAIPGSGHKLQMPATPEKVWRACQDMTAG